MMKRLQWTVKTILAMMMAAGYVAAAPKEDEAKPATPVKKPFLTPPRTAAATPAKPRVGSVAKPATTPSAKATPLAPLVPPKPAAAPAPAVAAAAPGDLKMFSFKSHPSIDGLVKALPAGVVKPQLASHLQALREGYGALIEGVGVSPDSRLFIVLADHSAHLYDDGKTKTPSQRIESADLEDMFHDVYPLKNPTDTLPLDFDPGRVRPEAFFKAIFGGSPGEVSRSLESVDFCGKKVSFMTRNGAADALRKVSADLTRVLAKQPELKIWMENLGGTYAWRPIAGTSLLSMHCYGVAIDLNTDKSAYWRWNKGDLKAYSRKTFPTEIIEAFERHGFIWGGKWSHYDTMHFEYRPEIIDFARRAGGGRTTAATEAEPTTGAAPTVTPVSVTAPAATPVASAPAPVPATPAPAVAATPGATPAPTGSAKRVALVMSGHPTSPGAAFPPMLALDKDPATLAAALKATGFAVTTSENPTLAGALAAIEAFGASLRPDTEVAVFYFTGHACQHEGQLFFLPKGAQVAQAADVFAEGISLARIKEALKKSENAQRVVLVEGARASFGAETSGGPGNAAAMEPGFFFGYASRGAAVAGRNENGGVFTQALARHLADPGVSVTDMFSRVAKDVSEGAGKTQGQAVQQPEATSTLSRLLYFGGGK
jgi:hypothetical protein